jgi:hypothetical protein
LHKARTVPKEEFKREVERHLTGKDSEPTEIIYFKLYKSQVPIIERAVETAALMLGSDKSRGYCLEMICADFLAGANVGNGDPRVVVDCVCRLFTLLSPQQRSEVFVYARELDAPTNSQTETAAIGSGSL